MNRKKEICSCYHVTKGDIADAVADGEKRARTCTVRKQGQAGMDSGPRPMTSASAGLSG